MKTVTTNEFAELLGVSRATIYRMRMSGELPPTIPLNRRVVRWNKEDIDLWLELECPKEKEFIPQANKVEIRCEEKKSSPVHEKANLKSDSQTAEFSVSTGHQAIRLSLDKNRTQMRSPIFG